MFSKTGAVIMPFKNTSTILGKIQKGYSLPHLSTVGLKLVEMATDESCSARDLAALIEKDPGLAAKVLKYANSAFYLTNHPVSSLHQAVVKLGFNQLRLMALTLSLREAFPMGKVGVLDYEKFWRISLYRGMISRLLARKLGSVDPEVAFTNGLIMEVGLLIMYDLCMKEDPQAPDIVLEPLEELLAVEEKHYGLNHRQVGQAALSYWGFPENLVDCQSRCGEETLNDEAGPLDRVYGLSREFAKTLVQEKAGFHAMFKRAEEQFGLDEEAIIDIVLITFDQVEEFAQYLSLEMDREDDLLKVMEKANLTLSRISSMIPVASQEAGNSLPGFDSLDERCDNSFMLQAVAHEIKNPLMVVGAFARKLSLALEGDSKSGQYARVIQDEALRLEKILKEMTIRKSR